MRLIGIVVIALYVIGVIMLFIKPGIVTLFLDYSDRIWCGFCNTKYNRKGKLMSKRELLEEYVMSSTEAESRKYAKLLNAMSLGIK